METFMRLYGNLIVFVYHCFDRIVINGYLSMLSRPENVVYFFHQVVGIPLKTSTFCVAAGAVRSIRSFIRPRRVLTRAPLSTPRGPTSG